MTDEPRGYRTREGVKDAMIAALQRELAEAREALRACEEGQRELVARVVELQRDSEVLREVRKRLAGLV